MGSTDLQNHFKTREDQFPRLVAQSLSLRCGVSTGEALVVAVSGGSDSMGMLHAMARIEGMDPRLLLVAHVNHGLRGEESDLDQDLVKRTCSVLGIRFVTHRVSVPNGKDAGGESLEMVCRTLRHAALAQICRDHRIPQVCLAHTADDQVEHFLLRLLRGAGSAGLRGMGWVDPSPLDPNVRLLRPVLDVTRVELRAFLSRIGGDFREDSSNNDSSIPRNRIRHEVLPMLRQVAGSSLDRRIRRSMDILGAEGSLAESMAALWARGPSDASLDSEHVAVQRIAIRNQLIRIGVEPGFRIIEALRRPGQNTVVVAGGRRITKNARGSLSVSPEGIHSTPVASATDARAFRVIPAGPDGFVDLPGPTRIEWRRMDRTSDGVRLPEADALFDAATLEGGFSFRHWRPGDRFRPLGMAGRTKLQDLFVNRKIPRSRRHELWVGEDSTGEVFWIEGFPPSEKHKVRSDTPVVLGMSCVRTPPSIEGVIEH